MEPFLSFALLAYNERDTLDRAARRCSAALEGCGHTYELVLVDDGSSDGSGPLMDTLAVELPRCRVIHHTRNLGIGAGIRTCYFQTRGAWATWFPADLQADPADLPRLLVRLPECDVLACYREAAGRQASLPRKLISSADRILVRLLFGLDLKDLHWIRFYRRELLDTMRLTCTSPTVDTEMIVQARGHGARIVQTPLPDHPRTAGSARGATLKSVAASLLDLLALRLRTFRAGRAARTD